MPLETADFDYNLPESLIAQTPSARRDASKLMVLRRAEAAIGHHVFSELPGLLHPNDMLVINDTRVIPAKFTAQRHTGGRIGGLFCSEPATGTWQVMLKNAGRCRIGEKLALLQSTGVHLELMEKLDRGMWTVKVDPPKSAAEVLARSGLTPLPPYIRRQGDARDASDQQRYQTVYAARSGAVAAPTAGLHFTDELIADLQQRGIDIVPTTLHVGLGTFTPVTVSELDSHKMHTEWYELSAESARLLNQARRDGRRIVAVGTTSVRVLETVAAKTADSGVDKNELFAPSSGMTDIFIYPPARFRAVDALITNFHLPQSTLLMLVGAFCSPGETTGVSMILDAYAQAVQQEYRFFSYGDAMLIE